MNTLVCSLGVGLSIRGEILHKPLSLTLMEEAGMIFLWGWGFHSTFRKLKGFIWDPGAWHRTLYDVVARCLLNE